MLAPLQKDTSIQFCFIRCLALVFFPVKATSFQWKRVEVKNSFRTYYQGKKG